MFTVNAINGAHDKVKTGADFPEYIREIKLMGVESFKTSVEDSHTIYNGAGNFQAVSEPVYDTLAISDTTDTELFRHYLKIHQQGETDYFTFCRHCAATGVYYWIVDLNNYTCTYFDKKDISVLEENIPH